MEGFEVIDGGYYLSLRTQENPFRPEETVRAWHIIDRSGETVGFACPNARGEPGQRGAAPGL